MKEWVLFAEVILIAEERCCSSKEIINLNKDYKMALLSSKTDFYTIIR